ncbi:MAG: tetratricopeptide repeat protein, partial [Candidatus Tectomicrobia bacterium]|nr:tetratricopeptide repeat protein [Candidatus Tectomicrobia bacterium]
PAIGDRLGEANVRCALGDLALAEGDASEAFTHYGAALEIYSAIHSQLGIGAALGSMGRAAAAAGQQAQAVLLHEQSLAVHRGIGERLGQAWNLNGQGAALLALGLHQAAFGAWWQARALARAIGLPLAARLDQAFAQIGQEQGQEAYQALIAALDVQAEAWRLEAVATLRQEHEQSQAE